MATTYEPIATTTLGSAAASIDFSSISSAYTDLRIVVVSPFLTGQSGPLYYRYNSSATGYSSQYLTGNGTTASAARTGASTSLWGGAITTSSGNISFHTLDIFSYTGSAYKTSLSTAQSDMNGSGSVNRSVGVWQNSSAINAISIFLSSGNLATNTTATLYGIKNA